MQATFTTIVLKDDQVNATGLPVPAEAVTAMGAGKKPKVKVSLNGYTYRSTVAAYGEVFMLPLSAEHRTAAGVQAGDTVEVTIELDTEPRTVEVPADLAAALAAKPGARPRSMPSPTPCARKLCARWNLPKPRRRARGASPRSWQSSAMINRRQGKPPTSRNYLIY